MSQDNQDVRATLSALNAACATRDLNAFMALFDDSDEILFVGSDKGEFFRGHEATRAFIQTLYGMPFVFSFDLGEVVIRQDAAHAWIFVDGKMVRTGDRDAALGKVGESQYRFSITLVKRDDRWRWQLFHGSVPGTE